MAGSSQKFIARNRAPRVQIEYDVELYGAEKKVQLPFVMGVMSDLSGKSEAPQPSIADRKFLEIDVDNFDDRMKSMKPRAAFTVPNTLTGEGNLAVDVTFESMDDFSPAAIARKVEPLRKLLEARTQLSNLMTYMDGKTGAENLVGQIIQDPTLLKALAGVDTGPETADALAALRQSVAGMPVATAVPDATAAAFDALKSAMPTAAATGPTDEAVAVLQALRDALPDQPVSNPTDATSILDGLRDAALPDPEADPVADILAGLLADTPPPDPGTDDAAATLAALRAGLPEDRPLAQDSADALASLRQAAPAAAEEAPDTPDALVALRALGEALPADPVTDDLAAMLAAMPDAAPDPQDTVADILTGLRETVPDSAETPAAPDALAALRTPGMTAANVDPDPLDDLLASFDAPAGQTTAKDADPLDDLLASFEAAAVPAADPLDDLLASFDAPADQTAAKDADPLDDLLAAFDAPAVPPAAMDTDKATVDPLDDLLAAFDAPPAAPADKVAADPLADLLADLEPAPLDPPLDPLADLMSELSAAAPGVALAPQDPFGSLAAPVPTPAQLRRPVFRMAVLGDFTGRSARGVMETGPALAKRRGIKLDVDTLDRTIAGMATTLVLPVGTDGAGIEVRLASLDDLHPDELYENVGIFSELAALRQRLSGSQAESAVRDMADWAGRFGTRAQPSYRQSSGSAVPADRKLGDFQRLIGDDEGVLQQPSPAGSLIARIVGPHVLAAPSSDVAACKALVDQALSDAMRLVLHHPEFQQIEAQWRTLEFLARRIETDASLQVVLYDISAKELAADLAAGEDLAQSGLFGLLADEPLSEGGAGGFSAVIGLYSFEETPPHAELLARIARIGAHVEAPFVTAIAPGFLDTPKADRHPLVAAAWDKLRAMPEARYLGIGTPRIMLRHPYGRKSEPIERFAFEEFTLSEGLSGMLWANPAALVAVLLAAAWTKDGVRMQLGGIMTLGDIPFHTFTDAHGDQVALPCTERNVTLTKMEEVVTRGFMPVVSIRGRDQVRLASFQSLGGGELRGPWSAAEARPEPSKSPVPQLVVESPVVMAEAETVAMTDDLDALLAGFGNDAAPQDPDAIDADLAALLEGL